MQLPRTAFTLPIAISENTPYTNQPRQHATFYRTPEEMADKEIVKCMFIDEPETDAAIEKTSRILRALLYQICSIYLELLKRM